MRQCNLSFYRELRAKDCGFRKKCARTTQDEKELLSRCGWLRNLNIRSTFKASVCGIKRATRPSILGVNRFPVGPVANSADRVANNVASDSRAARTTTWR